MSIQVESEKSGSTLIITVSGEINADNTLTFRKYIEETFSTFQTNVLFDLSNLEYINSMGIGTLIKTIKEVQKQKCKACLVGLNESIIQVLRITGLIAILHTFQTKKEGILYLSRNENR